MEYQRPQVPPPQGPPQVPPQGPPPQNQDYESQNSIPYTEKPTPDAEFSQAFKIEKPRYNDWPFAIFFLAVVGGFIIMAGITLSALRATWAFQGSSFYHSSNYFTLNANTTILFGFAVVISVVLSFCIILFARFASRFFITTGLILNIVLGLGTAIYYFAMKYYSAAVVFLVFSLFTAWCYWCARSRIPFSATVLEIAIDVMRMYKTTLLTSFIGIIVSGAFSALFSIVIVATYIKYSPHSGNPGCSEGGGSCSNGSLIGALVFIFFAGFYISEVIKNIIHVTISGVYGTWYYLANSDQGAPKYPAWGAFRRAMTYCFGSICEGSLIVALLQLLRAFVRILRNDSMAQGDVCAGCAFLILDMLIGFIEWMVSYFNHYAYIYVALYGKKYTKAAKETFELLRFKGMDALINDCFINTALQMYSLFVAYVATLFSYFYLRFTKPAYNDSGSYYAPVMAFTFLIAGQVTRIALAVLESGVSTFFVALAKDPEVFQMTNRDRFDEIFRNYPQVLEKLISKDDQYEQQPLQPYYQVPAQI